MGTPSGDTCWRMALIIASSLKRELNPFDRHRAYHAVKDGYRMPAAVSPAAVPRTRTQDAQGGDFPPAGIVPTLRLLDAPMRADRYVHDRCATTARPDAFRRWIAGADPLFATLALVPEIAGDVAAVDQAMRLGYNWSLGPFELIDRVGADWLADALARAAEAMPPGGARRQVTIGCARWTRSPCG